MHELLLFLPSPKDKSKFYYMLGRVMIFDDDTDLIEVCSIVLKSKNYEVRGFTKCTDILDEVRLFSPNVILMDNWMPDMSGVQAIQYIKAQEAFKRIPIIFFSASSNVEELAKQAGADELLKKPFDMFTLQQMIAKLVMS